MTQQGTAQEAKPDVREKIKGTRSLRERSIALVAEKISRANDLLSDLHTESPSVKATAIKAWMYAFDQGHEKYRPTLKLAGITKPNGGLQRCFRVAKWVTLTEIQPQLADLVKNNSLASLEERATSELKALGELAEKKAGKTQTTVQRCEAYVKSLYARLYKAEDASLEAGKEAKQAGKPLPVFNARALMFKYLVMGAGKAPGVGPEKAAELVANYGAIAIITPEQRENQRIAAEAQMAAVGVETPAGS